MLPADPVRRWLLGLGLAGLLLGLYFTVWGTTVRSAYIAHVARPVLETAPPGSGRLDPAHHRERARRGPPFGVGRPDGLAHRPRQGSLFAPGPVSRPRGPAASVLALPLGRPLRARAPEPRGPGPGAVGRGGRVCRACRRVAVPRGCIWSRGGRHRHRAGVWPGRGRVAPSGLVLMRLSTPLAALGDGLVVGGRLVFGLRRG